MSDFSESKQTVQDVNEPIIRLMAQMRSDPLRAEEAFEKLCAICAPGLAKLAGSYSRYGPPIDELQQIGRLAIWQCLSKFDEKRQVRFWTFAEIYIRGAMRRAIRSDRMIRIPADLQDKIYKMARCAETLASQLGRTPTSEEIAREMDWTEQEINFLLLRSQAFQLQSLDENAKQNTEAEISDTYVDGPSLVEASQEFAHSLKAEQDQKVFGEYVAHIYQGGDRKAAMEPLDRKTRRHLDNLLGLFGKYLHENGYTDTPLIPGNWSGQGTIDPTLRAKVLALKQAGLTYKEIAREAGGTEGAWKTWFQRYNAKLNPISLRPSAEPDED